MVLRANLGYRKIAGLELVCPLYRKVEWRMRLLETHPEREAVVLVLLEKARCLVGRLHEIAACKKPNHR